MEQIRDTRPALDRIEIAASGFAALGSEQRLAVLRHLVRAGEAGRSIGELGEAVGLSGATLTHHIRALTHAGLVIRQKEGRIIRVTVDFDRVRALSDYLLSECCADLDGCAHNG